jgi:hypothetical protein
MLFFAACFTNLVFQFELGNLQEQLVFKRQARQNLNSKGKAQYCGYRDTELFGLPVSLNNQSNYHVILNGALGMYFTSIVFILFYTTNL